MNISKPLLSPLLLKNNNQRRKSTKDLGIGTPRKPIISPLIEETSIISFKTLERRYDIRKSLILFTSLEADTSTSRLLAKKIKKSFNNQLFENAYLKEKIKTLETQLETTKSKKKEKDRDLSKFQIYYNQPD